MSSASDVVLKYVQRGELVGDRYEIEDFLDAGAYGAIFSAIDTVSMERVAVKALPPADDGVNRTAMGRFQREMKVIQNLRHPNIITMYDYGETDKRIVYMVLEFVDGGTLFDRVSTRSFNLEEGLSVTRQIAEALDHAHGKGVIHRDLKPQNIMLVDERGGGYAVKVLDFGMAKLMSRLGDESIVQLTREGVAVGTPRYIAPEQARGKDVGPYSDLYALGLLTYEIFSGERAVKADSIETAIMAHVNPRPLELDEIDSIPEIVHPILFRMIEKKVASRYQTAAEVVADIEELEKRIWAGDPTLAVETAENGGSDEAPTQERSPPGEAPKESGSGRVRSIHSADRLELDFDRPEASQPREPAAPRPTSRGGFGDRAPTLLKLPSNVIEWAELAVTLVLAVMSFILLTAHFEGMSGVPRTLIGALPMLVAGAVALALQSHDWRLGFFRFLLIASVISIVVAHLLGPGDLAVGLLRNPAWFLEPVRSLPGMDLGRDIVAGFARAHARLLMSMSSDVANQAIGNPH